MVCACQRERIPAVLALFDSVTDDRKYTRRNHVPESFSKSAEGGGRGWDPGKARRNFLTP